MMKCFLVIDQAKNVLYIPCDDSYISCCFQDAVAEYVKDSDLIKQHKTLKELDQTIHNYIKG